MATIEGMENLYQRVYEQFYSSNIRFQEARLAQEQIAQSLANTVNSPYINDWTNRLSYLNSIHEQLARSTTSFDLSDPVITQNVYEGMSFVVDTAKPYIKPEKYQKYKNSLIPKLKKYGLKHLSFEKVNQIIANLIAAIMLAMSLGPNPQMDTIIEQNNTLIEQNNKMIQLQEEQLELERRKSQTVQESQDRVDTLVKIVEILEEQISTVDEQLDILNDQIETTNDIDVFPSQNE